MKKWFILMVFMLTLFPVFAGTAVDNGQDFLQTFYSPYSKKEMVEYIDKFKPLNYYQIPAPFWYVAKRPELNNEADILVFRLAEKKYKQHPQNFAAVFNYATLLMSLNADTDDLIDCSSAQIQEAYRLLEKAKKLRPDYLPVYAQQDLLLELQIFGAPVYMVYPQYNIYQENPVIPVYREQKELARKRLAVQEKLLASGQGDAVTAYEISVALGLDEKAAVYESQVQELAEALDSAKDTWEQKRAEFIRLLSQTQQKVRQAADELGQFLKGLQDMTFCRDTVPGKSVSRCHSKLPPLTPEDRFMMEEELNRRMEGRPLFRGLPSK